ncbi:putative dNMP kinase [Caulobacter phage C1]|nr:putative dNMP kinase [Caulobacter phage C1]UTU08413.1 putative dNMP kinase [Caulobacter phage C2]UTU08930.1 putative dNMP kinase [Caulobacter phage J4]UTU10046.1 putative dNMP kinase [Caulobacter phage RB23]WGN97081.1 putative dNMP kinase [Bertelyvirus sp.]
MKVFAFIGKKGAGKDTAADTLVDQGFTKFALTDKVKQIVRDVYGVTVEEQTDRVLKETQLKRWPYLSPRQLDRLVAEDMFRGHDPDTWVHYGERAIRNLLLDGKRKIAVSDLRRPNEAAMLRDRFDATVIRIVNPRLADNDKHASEAEQEQVVADYTIYNERGVRDFQQAVLAIAGY